MPTYWQTLFSNLLSALPAQNAKWAGFGGRPAGTIFIVISQNSPGFIWKLACRSRWAALFQAADVTALARAKSFNWRQWWEAQEPSVQRMACVWQRKRERERKEKREREGGIHVLDRSAVESTLSREGRRKSLTDQTPGKFICILL